MRKALVALAAVVLSLVMMGTAGAATGSGSAINARGMSPRSIVAPDVIAGNEQAAFNYFVARGLTAEQAAGVVGNLDQESGMDPTIAQYGGGPGRGLAQWGVGGRWDTYAGDNENAYTSGIGVSEYDLDGQLQFIWYELTSFSYYGLSSLQGSSTISDATVAFENDFEGCSACNESARISYAQNAYNSYA